MLSLQATIRDKKENPAKTRKQGFLPAVLYGEGVESAALQVEEKAFSRVFKEAGESQLILLEVKDKKYEALIHQLERDPLSGQIIHLDFFHPSAKKKVEAEIPLIFEGIAPAVKDFGGVLVKEADHIMVKGLAQKLPREIRLDLSGLVKLDDRITVADLPLPEGVTAMKEPRAIVAIVAAPKKEKEEIKPAAAAEATAEAGAEAGGASGAKPTEPAK